MLAGILCSVATYKLMQDIEAEDHIIGPLSLRQFIYALIAAFCGYLSFIAIAKHAAFLLAVLLPPGLFCLFFAFPFGKDQSTEVWALAKLRFLFKPRKRIWDQSGVKQLVTVTAPKKVERTYTDGLSQTEVRSRLKALANTIDSRGWAIKNVNVNMYSQPSLLAATGTSDRLIDVSSIPQAVPDYDVQASDDILDETSNPVAQQVSQLMGASSQARRQQLLDEMNNAPTSDAKKQAGADYWFLNQPATAPKVPKGNAVFSAPVVAPGSDTVAVGTDATPEEAALVARGKKQQDSLDVSYAHLRTIQPLGAAPNAPASDYSTVTSAAPSPAMQQLANDNDKNISTLAREAKRAKGEDLGDDEVTISLH